MEWDATGILCFRFEVACDRVVTEPVHLLLGDSLRFHVQRQRIWCSR